MSDVTDMRVDSRGLLMSVGDFCIIIHKDKENTILLTAGFYEGENNPPTKHDFAVAPTTTITLGNDAQFKGALVFRLHSMFEEKQLEDFMLLGLKTLAAYEKNKRLVNTKGFMKKLNDLCSAPDKPFNAIESLEFDDGTDIDGDD